MRVLLAGLLSGLTLSAPAQDGPAYRFHHLHLNDDRPPFLLEFYERLFDPATTSRVTEDGMSGLRSGPMLLLIGKGGGRAEPSALWHFGWGGVSLGETYLAHARREVAWEPPLPAGQLHLHLRSVTPNAAADWYRTVLGARVETPPPPPQDRRAPLPAPEHRMPEALVWLGGTGLLIYRTEPPLFSTRGQRADHLALACEDLDAALAHLRGRGVEIAGAPVARGRWRTAMLEGPDRLAIELVEAP